MSRAFPGAVLTDHLDLDSLPRGKVSRLRLELVQDGLGRPLRLPVLVARGQPGPVLGLTAALHGNELNGIPVIHGVFAGLNVKRLVGTVVGVVVNVPGILSRQREYDDGTDLNHVMPGRARGNTHQVFAHRFLERVVRHFDLLIDLHTASFGRVNCLYVRADMTHPTAARLAYLQRPQIILHNPPSDHTLRGAAQALGIPAATLEIGDPHRFQRHYIKRARVGVRAVLADEGMVKGRPITLGDPPVLCEASEWIYTDRGGLLEVLPSVASRVAKGEPIARMVDIYGDEVAEWTAPYDGIVIGRSVDPVAETGARILHLGRLAPEGHPFVRRTVSGSPQNATGAEAQSTRDASKPG